MRFKLLAATIFLVLGLPLATSALTLQDIQQQLRFVAVQIKTLQSQSQYSVTAAAAGALTSSPECPVLTQELANGDTGAEVISLQEFLMRKGEIPSDTFTQMQKGYFGHLTQVALESWQTQNNLLATGKTDSVTRGKIAGACKSGEIPTPEVTFAVNKETVVSGQEVTLSWQTRNATKCTVLITPQGGKTFEAAVALNGSYVLHPNISTAAQIECANEPGTEASGPRTTKKVSFVVTDTVSLGANTAQLANVLSAIQAILNQFAH